MTGKEACEYADKTFATFNTYNELNDYCEHPTVFVDFKYK